MHSLEAIGRLLERLTKLQLKLLGSLARFCRGNIFVENQNFVIILTNNETLSNYVLYVVSQYFHHTSKVNVSHCSY